MAQRDMSCITSLSYEALVSYVVIQLFFFLITGFIKYQEHVTLRGRLDPKNFGFWLTVAFRLYLVISV